MDNSQLKAFLKDYERRARLAVALSAYPIAEPLQREAFLEYLASVPWSQDGSFSTIGELAFSAQLDAVIGTFFGDTDAFMPWMFERMNQPNIAQREREVLARVGESLDPSWAGCYMEVHSEGTGLGWIFPEDNDIFELVGLLEAGPHEAHLTDWAEELGLEIGRRLARSVVVDQPLTQLITPLGDDVMQLEDALEGLQVEFPDDLIDALIDTEHPHIAMRLTCEPGAGLVRVGAIAEQPSRELMMLWLSLARTPQANLDTLAQVEGMIGAELPSAIEWHFGAEDSGIDVHYTTRSVTTEPLN